MKTLDEMIAVMEAYKAGKAIQLKTYFHDSWSDVQSPSWDWEKCDYRVKPESDTPRLLWVQIMPGQAYAHLEKPALCDPPAIAFIELTPEVRKKLRIT